MSLTASFYISLAIDEVSPPPNGSFSRFSSSGILSLTLSRIDVQQIGIRWTKTFAPRQVYRHNVRRARARVRQKNVTTIFRTWKTIDQSIYISEDVVCCCLSTGKIKCTTQRLLTHYTRATPHGRWTQLFFTLKESTNFARCMVIEAQSLPDSFLVLRFDFWRRRKRRIG